MKLKMLNINLLFNSLLALEGRAKVVVVNNQSEVVVEPYKFDSETQLAIIMNINALRPIVEASNAADRKSLIELSNQNGSIKDGTPEMVKLLEFRQIAADTETDIKLRRFDVSKLKLDNNQIGPGIVAGLMPILKISTPPTGEEE